MLLKCPNTKLTCGELVTIATSYAMVRAKMSAIIGNSRDEEQRLRKTNTEKKLGVRTEE